MPSSTRVVLAGTHCCQFSCHALLMPGSGVSVLHHSFLRASAFACRCKPCMQTPLLLLASFLEKLVSCEALAAREPRKGSVYQCGIYCTRKHGRRRLAWVSSESLCSPMITKAIPFWDNTVRLFICFYILYFKNDILLYFLLYHLFTQHVAWTSFQQTLYNIRFVKIAVHCWFL